MATTTSALIGYTGLVGSTLLRRHRFDRTFNRANADELDGCSFDLVVCAAAPAEKWMANNDPERDWQNIALLVEHLRRTDARQFVLVSTVDVYPEPRGVNEATAVEEASTAPYGRHRRRLELAVLDRFPHALVVRLPALFGPGLKKNLVFDLLQQRDESFVTPSSEFQFYDLGWLWADIQQALDAGLTLVNLTTPPVTAERVATEVFETELPPSRRPLSDVHYDVHSLHAPVWGRQGHYQRNLDDVLDALHRFVRVTKETA